MVISNKNASMHIRRRTFIRSTGISLALPWLNVFADDSQVASSAKQPPRRMICICAPLGLHPDNFFPTQSGKDYTLSPYLDILKDYRDEFTVISGLAHAGMGSSFAHHASASFLTGAPGAGRPGFARLFLEGNAADVQEQIRRLEDGRSILDDVGDQANSLRSDLGSDDRDKLRLPSLNVEQ